MWKRSDATRWGGGVSAPLAIADGTMVAKNEEQYGKRRADERDRRDGSRQVRLVHVHEHGHGHVLGEACPEKGGHLGGPVHNGLKFNARNGTSAQK